MFSLRGGHLGEEILSEVTWSAPWRRLHLVLVLFSGCFCSIVTRGSLQFGNDFLNFVTLRSFAAELSPISLVEGWEIYFISEIWTLVTDRLLSGFSFFH